MSDDNDIYPENALILAPLSGFTDIPYRRSARRHGCHFAFTEMVDAGALAHGAEKTLRMLDRDENEPWLGVQIVGALPEEIAEAARIVSDRDFNVVDFNLGCPAPKVARKGEGAALAAKLDDAARAFEALARNSRHPATAKIRILHPEDPEPSVELAKKLENAGAATITVHGRIRSQFYSGNVAHNVIKAIKESVDCQVVANGGVTGKKSYDEIRRETNCDTVMLARGAMGNPWIFGELRDQERWNPPTPDEFADEIKKHILDMIQRDGPERGLKKARKVLMDYMRGRGFPRTLKTLVVKIKDEKDLDMFTDQLRNGPTQGRIASLIKHPETERRLTLNP